MSDESPLDDIRIGQVTRHWAASQKISTRYFESTNSTNEVAKAEAFSEDSFNEHLKLYVAEMQSAGKGRGTNKWSNAATGSQLLSTWSFMIEKAPHPTVSPMMGLAVFRAAQSTWPFLNWSLKAPNDLYVGNKKIAGLLLETVTQGSDHRLLIGFGFNAISFPHDIPTATSLVDQLPASAPLLAEDWICFLERLVFEFSFSLQMSYEPMNSTSSLALLTALNQNPLLKEIYLSLDAQGNLHTAGKKISWMEL